MAGKNMRLTVSTPERTVLDTDADFILLRTVEGDMGVLHGHEAGAALLDYGVLRAFVDKRQTDILAVLGGFAMVAGDRVTVLTDFAELPDKLEEAIAAREKERTEKKLAGQKLDMEMQRAEAAMRHILVNMDISSYSILKGHEEKPESDRV